MSLSLNFYFLLITLTAIISLISQRRHVLMCLLSLEGIILSLAFALTMLHSSLSTSYLFFAVVILTFGACEAAVALAVLVILTRAYGSDMISLMNLSKC